jgi:hypothetical protein
MQHEDGNANDQDLVKVKAFFSPHHEIPDSPTYPFKLWVQPTLRETSQSKPQTIREQYGVSTQALPQLIPPWTTPDSRPK